MHQSQLSPLLALMSIQLMTGDHDFGAARPSYVTIVESCLWNTQVVT